MIGAEGKPIPVTEWTLRYEGYAPREEGLREALCTTGNGYFATRGAAPESAADSTHYPGTYIAGCYNALRTEIAGRSVQSESLVNAPNWLPLTFAAGDGPWLDLDRVEVLQCQQELDLRRGVLTRKLRIRDSQGRIMPHHMPPVRAHGGRAPGRAGDDHRAGELVREAPRPVRTGRHGGEHRCAALPPAGQPSSGSCRGAQPGSGGCAARGGDQPVAHPHGRGFPDPPVPQWRSRGPRTRP